jgi:hypothetical protein
MLINQLLLMPKSRTAGMASREDITAFFLTLQKLKACARRWTWKHQSGC